MADFIATTVCEPAIITDIEAVEKIMDKYEFSAEVLLQHNLLYVYGYEWFNAWKYNAETDEVDYENDATDDFLKEVQPYIEDELQIQMIGHEKCRYIGAAQVTVTKEKIIWRTLSGDDFSVLQRLQLYRQRIHEIAKDAEITKTPAEIDEILSQETDIKEIVSAAKAVGVIALLLEVADFLNIDANEYIPYSVLLR
jgi:hypothetical protein